MAEPTLQVINVKRLLRLSYPMGFYATENRAENRAYFHIPKDKWSLCLSDWYLGLPPT